MARTGDRHRVWGQSSGDLAPFAPWTYAGYEDSLVLEPGFALAPDMDIVPTTIRDSTLSLAGRQVVFIDSAVTDAELLAAGVNTGVVAIILPAGQDGITAIADWLTANNAHDLASIAIVAHGANGLLLLGSGALEIATIARYQDALGRIGDALQAGGDILLYGCDVAQDAAGVAFVNQLSGATGGANVAAASHIIGSSDVGGSFDLDINTGAIEAASPFTADTQASFDIALPTAINQLFFTTRNAPSPFAANRIEQIGVTGTTQVGTPINLRDGSQQTFTVLQGVAVDPSLGKYFVVNSNASTANQILQGDVINGGSLTVLTSLPTSTFQILGIAIDQPNHDLYYSVASTISGSIGIWKINEFTATPTQVISGFATTNVPQKIALDLPNNLVYIVDNRGIGQASTLWVGNLLSHTATVLTTRPAGSLLSGVAVNNGTLYFSTINGGVASVANNNILAAPLTITGSGASATASLGSTTTLYAGANARVPVDIEIDPASGLLYSAGADTPTGAAFTNVFINVGTITGGASAIQNIFTLSNGTNGVTASGLFLETTPTITATGTATFAVGGSAVTLAPTAKVTNPSGFNLAKATVAITAGGFTNDGGTLTAITAGTSISASFSTGTLTLSGDDTLAHYQQVLDTVAFKSTAVDPTNGNANLTRTVSWTINDGLIASTTPTTTISIHGLATVVAGGASSFSGGGLPVALDPGLTVSDPFSTTLTGATIAVGGFISGDVLNFTNQGGIVGNYTSANGTLTLSGTVSVAAYQTALRSITYSFNPSNGDPTGGGSKTSRTINWLVDDGVTKSTTATSSLTTIHVAPTIVTAGTVTFGGGNPPPALAPTLTVIAPNSSGLLSSATVTIDGGTLPGDGDVLAATTAGTSITATYNAATEQLTLTGSDTVANYQSVLRSVTISSTSLDPTGGGTTPNRTFSWVVNDGVAPSAPSSSFADALICFCPDTMILTPSGEVPVQDLRRGDMVLTHDGRSSAIVWVGTGQVRTVPGRRTAANPIIVRRHALAENVPNADLHVTKGHSFLLDGVLIPVEFLVNHRSILWDDDARNVTVYHLELPAHDVLVANGAPAESYRDDGNRWLFQNANTGWDQPAKPPYAPVLTGGPIVDAVWRRLLERAPAPPPPPLTDDPDLHLLADGRRINPHCSPNGRHVFNLPAHVREVRIVSRSACPDELGLARDPRMLGVAIEQIQIWRGADLKMLDASDDCLDTGFHAFEAELGIRWTDGSALVPPSLLDGLNGPAELILLVGGSTRYSALAQAA